MLPVALPETVFHLTAENLLIEGMARLDAANPLPSLRRRRSSAARILRRLDLLTGPLVLVGIRLREERQRLVILSARGVSLAAGGRLADLPATRCEPAKAPPTLRVGRTNVSLVRAVPIMPSRGYAWIRMPVRATAPIDFL